MNWHITTSFFIKFKFILFILGPLPITKHLLLLYLFLNFLFYLILFYKYSVQKSQKASFLADQFYT